VTAVPELASPSQPIDQLQSAVRFCSWQEFYPEKQKAGYRAASARMDKATTVGKGTLRVIRFPLVTRSVQRGTKWTEKAKKFARKTSEAVVGFVRHPVPVTCLDCGFLAFEAKEVTSADRILLHCEGSAGLPCTSENLTKYNCTRSLWVDYDLTYFGGSAAGIFDELKKRRRCCGGYLKYRPGFAPSEHRDLLLKRMDSNEKLKFAVLGAITGGVVALFFAWVAKHFGLKAP
jgi:hypothetical protein